MLNEAIVEHIAQSLISGNVDVVDPSDERRDHSSTYLEERFILYALCSFGVKPVDIRVFIDAYFEDGAERERLGKDSAHYRLSVVLQQAFPQSNIMSRLSMLESKDSLRGTKKIISFAKSLAKEGMRAQKRGFRRKVRVKDFY
jgi:hypothetical protein